MHRKRRSPWPAAAAVLLALLLAAALWLLYRLHTRTFDGSGAVFVRAGEAGSSGTGKYYRYCPAPEGAYYPKENKEEPPCP